MTDVVTLLNDLKSRLETARRFSLDPNNWLSVIAQTEGDIEEFLIDNGLRLSEEREANDKLAVHQELLLYSSAAGIAGPDHFHPRDLELAKARRAQITNENSYLGGKRRAQLIRVTTFTERLEG